MTVRKLIQEILWCHSLDEEISIRLIRQDSENVYQGEGIVPIERVSGVGGLRIVAIEKLIEWSNE